MTITRGAAGLLLSLLAFASPAEEYIESFHSDIDVQQNGDLRITETIVVYAEGDQIRRGIYRDFPTRYRTSRGQNFMVGFEVQGVTRDGRPEPFFTESLSNGERVYIGDANVFLEPGFYEYRLSYRTSRQLGYFDDFDELYWNVTGTGWAFRIDRASAEVTLPGPVTDFRLTGYTGPQGSSAQELEHRRSGGDSAYFESRTPLAPREGLTIVAGWPKGLVDEPSTAQRRAWFIEDNLSTLVIGGGVLALLVYYLLFWHRFGRDPESGVIVPLYRAPEGYSPASMRFVERMGYDNKCFTSAVVNLAVKGAVEIDDKGKNFTIRRLGSPKSELAAGEKQVIEGLFKGDSDEIDIKRTNHSTLSAAISKHERSLEFDYEKRYFRTNGKLLVLPVLASMILIGVAIAYLPSEEVVFKTIFAGLFGFVPLLVFYSILRALLRRTSQSIVRKAALAFVLVQILVFFSFFAFYVIPFGELADSASLPVIIGAISILIMHIVFYNLLKAPTLAGRRLLDQIEGFRHYLEVAEKDELALENAPQFTTDLYEAYLPYAIALDLENEWTAKLDRAIAGGLVDRGYQQPHWYRSHSHRHSHFSNTLSNSLNTAIASSSIAPGSSSGSSGSSGGSSGGGGGGGGGGGW